MAAKGLCIKCNLEFPSVPLYDAHKESNHKDLTGGVSLSDNPPQVPVGSEPTPEFMETVKRIEAKEEPISPASQHPSELPKAKPIVLQYIWIGEHEDCRKNVSTLELELEGKYFTIAYCDACKRQLQSKEVAKL